MNYLLVFLGGGAGCIIRYLIGQAFLRSQIQFPVATLLANISACVIFAVVIWFNFQKEDLHYLTRPLFLTGFCGGLSTFSAFGYENYILLQKQMYGYAFGNIIISIVLCTGIFFVVGKFGQS